MLILVPAHDIGHTGYPRDCYLGALKGSQLSYSTSRHADNRNADSSTPLFVTADWRPVQDAVSRFDRKSDLWTPEGYMQEAMKMERCERGSHKSSTGLSARSW